MISKRIGIAPKNDNYARLARYIAAAGQDEKLLTSWCAGCAEEDYAEGIAEVADAQALNTRTAHCKTYHLIVSFRPEDADKLTPEAFREIEKRFAEVLGLSEHQRHCAVHTNTGNLHMHIAYNLIHPERLTMREPFRDFHKRDRLCRELEREYGLAVDRGRGSEPTPEPERPALGDKAAQAEAHSGQESFESYAKRHAQDILAAVNAAQDWQAAHTALSRFSLEIKPHGNGLVLKDRHGKHAVKASAVDRSLSLKKLEARFGPYNPSQELEHSQERDQYQAEPLQRSPERGNLFAEYRQGIEERKARLQTVKEQEDAALAAIREQWTAKRKELERMGIAKKNRRNLLTLARKHEAEAVAKAKLDRTPEREAVRRDVPFTCWNGFLQRKAEQGSEIALAVLRSRQETVAEDKEAAPVKDWSRHGTEQFLTGRAEYAAKERALLEREDIAAKGKTRLLSVLRMERLAAENSLNGFRHRVDHKGAVIFSLPGGGVIRDEGQALYFSPRMKRSGISPCSMPGKNGAGASLWKKTASRGSKSGSGKKNSAKAWGVELFFQPHGHGVHQFARPYAERRRQTENHRQARLFFAAFQSADKRAHHVHLFAQLFLGHTAFLPVCPQNSSKLARDF
jgi:hypothetical protein